jgi:hypothetical protein
MYIVRKIINYFYPYPAIEAAKKDYAEYFNTAGFQNYRNVLAQEELPVAEPIIIAPTSMCYLKLIHEAMHSMEEVDVNDKILSVIEAHNRLVEELIKLKEGSAQIEDIEMKNLRPGRTPGSKCLCH